MTRYGGRNFVRRNNVQHPNLMIQAMNMEMNIPAENHEELIPFRRMYEVNSYVQIRTDGGWGLGADDYGEAMGGDPPPGGMQPQFGNIVRIINFDHAEDTGNQRVPRIYFYNTDHLPFYHNLGNTLVYSEAGLVPANQIAPPVFGGRSTAKRTRKLRKPKRKYRTRTVKYRN